MTAGIADLGVGNLRSIRRALEHVGVDAEVVPPGSLLDADLMVLPGVGAFGAAAEAIAPIRDDLADALEAGRPCIGICLGLQLLFEESQESPGDGLGVFAGDVRRFPAGRKVPHMGWSPVTVDDETLADGLDDAPYMYFAHSYHPVPQDDEVVAATCEYGGTFAAAVRRERTIGFQFHPEKSGDAGLALLANALDALGVDR